MRLPPNTGAGWGVRGIYLVALILAGFMLFFDATIRRFYYKEMNKKEIEDTIGDIDAQARYDLRAKIANWEKIKADPNASAQEVGRAKERLAHYQKVYGDVSAI